MIYKKKFKEFEYNDDTSMSASEFNKRVEKFLTELSDDLQLNDEIDIYAVLLADAVIRYKFKLDDIIKRTKDEIKDNKEFY